MRKQKAKLLLTLSVATLSVLTMGVSTFAWFQAQAEVHVQTTTESTTITVSKPESVNIESAVLYRRNAKYVSSTSILFNTGSGDAGFTEVANIAAGDKSLNLEATEKATYCLVVTASSGGNYQPIASASLELKTFVNVRPGSQSHKHYKVPNTSTAPSNNSLIAFTDALLIGGSLETSATAGNEYTYSSGRSIVADLRIASGSDLSTELNPVYNLYFYFTIEFSNAPSTYYQEYTYANSTYTIAYQDQPNSGHRYFIQSNSGNSNCYAGWNFNITNLLLTIG